MEPETQRSRPNSRRNSATLSRRSSLTNDKEAKKSPLNTTPNSATSTPKKQAKPQEKQSQLDFVVTGKQILKRSDRAYSLPGAYHRRQSVESAASAKAKKVDSPRRLVDQANNFKSRETSLEDDMSLDLSQVSDFEDTNSKYGVSRFQALATSTPNTQPRNKPRSASLHNQLHSQKVENRRGLKSAESLKQSRDLQSSRSRDSLKTSSAESSHRYPTELDYSSVSPEYSGQSSADLSPSRATQFLSPRSQDLQASSCCVSSWQDCSSFDHTKGDDQPPPNGGEWNEFWANYNNSLSKVPMKSYYDQCPTPYRTETFDLADFELSDVSRKRSPENIQAINNIICNEGLHLTPRETQNIIKCAHLLGNVLTRAIDRRTKIINEDPELPELKVKKKHLTLDLKETIVPAEVKEEKRCETVTTQTDISLPNTKTAPRIFENILRQLSRSSIDVEKVESKEIGEKKEEEKS